MARSSDGLVAQRYDSPAMDDRDESGGWDSLVQSHAETHMSADVTISVGPAISSGQTKSARRGATLRRKRRIIPSSAYE